MRGVLAAGPGVRGVLLRVLLWEGPPAAALAGRPQADMRPVQDLQGPRPGQVPGGNPGNQGWHLHHEVQASRARSTDEFGASLLKLLSTPCK